MLPLFCILVCFSGACALIYQVLWLRQLGLVFGVTTQAASTVLAAFMGGLAAGSLLAGRVADGVRHPLLWFAGAEALIAVAALATQPGFGQLQPLYAAVYGLVPEGGWPITAVRFASASALLLVPTMLMGATLPLIVRAVVRRVEVLGSRVAVLYSLNTAGAIAGTLLAAYVLIPGVGIAVAFQLAATANLAVAIAAVVAWRLSGVSAPANTRTDHATGSGDDGQPLAPAIRRAILAVFVISGFVALALEVVWFRVLLAFLPATTYAFAVMLATVLAGIAAGSALAPLLLRRPANLVRRLALLEIAMPATVVFSLAALGLSYQAGWRTGALIQACVLAIFPASLIMGCAFPIGVHLWTAGAHDAGARLARRVGGLYAINVVGGIGGATAAGFLLLPAYGSRGSLLVLSACALLGGAILLFAAGPARRAIRPLSMAVVLTGIAFWLLPDPASAVLARRYPGEEVVWRRHGTQGTVSVHRRSDGARVLYLDGLHQANDSPEMVRVHRLIGTIAAALHAEPRRALVVGLGGGVTPGAVASHPGLQVDVVELSETVVQAAGWFSHVNQDVLSRPLVRLQVNDGRNHLLLGPRPYDIITADIIQPFHAGAGNLYSAEYFRLARGALTDEGLMVQWIGERPATQYRLIARTFQSVFPEATAWAGGTILVGGANPLRLTRASFERRLQDSRWRDTLATVGLASFDDLERAYTAGPAELRRFVGEGPILTDDRPLVEFFLSLPRREPDIDLAPLQDGQAIEPAVFERLE